MYHPTTRVLTVLELLQAYPAMSGPELARRLEVSQRSVRRYIAMLQDMGVPVEGGRGRSGAYRLRPGFKLPPLMFSDDEALALTLGLVLARRQLAVVGRAGVEGALAKVERVLPERLRARVRALQDVLTVSTGNVEYPPAGAVVLALAEAAHLRQAVRLCHRADSGQETERTIEPYGVVCYGGRWFVTGHCRMRQSLRTFRLDRVLAVEALEEVFARPDGFDAVAEVERSLAATPGAYQVRALLETELSRARELFPPAVADLEQRPDGVLMRCNVQRLDWLALRVMGIGCAVRQIEPPELRDEFRRLAEHALNLAGASAAHGSSQKM